MNKRTDKYTERVRENDLKVDLDKREHKEQCIRSKISFKNTKRS